MTPRRPQTDSSLELLDQLARACGRVERGWRRYLEYRTAERAAKERGDAREAAQMAQRAAKRAAELPALIHVVQARLNGFDATAEAAPLLQSQSVIEREESEQA